MAFYLSSAWNASAWTRKVNTNRKKKRDSFVRTGKAKIFEANLKLKLKPRLNAFASNDSPRCIFTADKNCIGNHSEHFNETRILTRKYFSRNAGAAVLHRLLGTPADDPQHGDLQVLRPRHLGRHRPQRHHHGHGVLHDAQSKEPF